MTATDGLHDHWDHEGIQPRPGDFVVEIVATASVSNKFRVRYHGFSPDFDRFFSSQVAAVQYAISIAELFRSTAFLREASNYRPL
jgi:hypothetical protein